jgi:hypothetical protein
VLSDLAALTPPFLVCAAFLIAVGAFLKREMGQQKNSSEDDHADDSARLSELSDGVNAGAPGDYAEYRSGTGTEDEAEPDQDSGT